MKRKALVIATLDKSSGIDMLSITFIHKGIYGLGKENYITPADGHSFITMYNDVLYEAKLHDYKIDYYYEAGARFYNIFWSFPERGVYNERYAITDEVRKV